MYYNFSFPHIMLGSNCIFLCYPQISSMEELLKTRILPAVKVMPIALLILLLSFLLGTIISALFVSAVEL